MFYGDRTIGGIIYRHFGAGAALTVIPIRRTIAASGYEQAFLWFGIGEAIVLFAVAALLQGPDSAQAATSPRPLQPAVSLSGLEMLRSLLFRLLKIMFVCVSAGGLTATAQLGPIAFGAQSDRIGGNTPWRSPSPRER